MDQRLWKLSLLTGEAVARLPASSVMFYVCMFLFSIPLLALIVAVAIRSGVGHDEDPVFLTLFGLYAALSLWAFVESTLVLRRRNARPPRRRPNSGAPRTGDG